ncbi:MAG TPA: tryptophan--tRNA ligase [Vitreimonas sp.]|uniref:tryptophan--tRNA ligase n=1 Tax=Vitreimonas sp. TaxID=3069702 RepID=UPI002D73CE3D|nr:tryptophan--tRNA ligase [Vitreimonas sp.]HYD89632.1 tryptophan--tRNA ligase [Vitreimonas sp.]
MTDAPQETRAPDYKGPKRVFSGMQPTNGLHLGNYLGALQKFVALQDQYECIYCIVDLHAITTGPDPENLVSRCREVAAAYVAAGVDPKRSTIFIQSAVREHTELAWLFNCVARMGWVERMTQFKDKAGKHSERVSVGLFDYPVLQAADILLYKATHVPVGEDQKQHLELSRDIAQKFNNDHNAPGFFPLPEPLIQGPGARIMSLRDGTKKMSKSDPSDMTRINMTDDADTILTKIKKATTDPQPLPETKDGLAGRAEVENLVGIFAAVTERSVEDVLTEFGGKGFGVFKPALAEALSSKLAPIAAEMRRLQADTATLDAILKDGAEKARAVAQPIMAEVRDVVGLWRA